MRIKLNSDIKIEDTIIWFLTVLLQFTFTAQSLNDYGRYIFLGITLAVFVLLCFKYKLVVPFKINEYMIFTALFALYCMFTALYSNTPGKAIQQGITVLEILICVSVFYIYYKEKDITEFLSTFMCSGYLLAAYTIYRYGLSQLVKSASSGIRLSSEDIANSNSIGMSVAFAVVISLYFVLEKKQYLLIIPSVLSMVVVAASGSRKALLIVVLCFLFFLLLYLFTASGFKKKIRILIILLAIVAFVVAANEMNLFMLTNARMGGLFGGSSREIDNSTAVRQKMIDIGLELFSQSPFLGNGMANTAEIIEVSTGQNYGYLHNNYVEILAGGGIFGFIIYYSLYLIPLITLLHNRLYQSTEGKIILTVLLCNLIMDYGAVSYYSKQTYFYIALYFIYTDKYRRKIKIGDLVI